MNRKIIFPRQTIKNVVFLAILMATTISWLFYLWTNEKGFMYAKKLTIELAQEELKVRRWEAKIDRLKLEIYEWETNPFMTEKVAREELQLMLPDETVYKA